jgi:hypothetical protein
MITEAVTYDYHPSGHYATTVASLPDGRVVTIDTQYGVVEPHGEHGADCQIGQIGGTCTCGLLDGIDVEALVADARARGKRGMPPPDPVDPAVAEQRRQELERFEASPGVCPRCGTYCQGDCGAHATRYRGGRGRRRR